MEDAIKTVVKVFVKSAKGGDSMGGKDFDNLVKKQLGNVLTVRLPSLNTRRIVRRT